jgi:3-oxoacyl-(acyl-carrier-protein) synthase
MISGQLSIMLGLKGPSFAIVSACTTGTHSIGEAGRMIQYGDVDVMLLVERNPLCRHWNRRVRLDAGAVHPQ